MESDDIVPQEERFKQNGKTDSGNVFFDRLTQILHTLVRNFCLSS